MKVGDTFTWPQGELVRSIDIDSLSASDTTKLIIRNAMKVGWAVVLVEDEEHPGKKVACLRPPVTEVESCSTCCC